MRSSRGAWALRSRPSRSTTPLPNRPRTAATKSASVLDQLAAFEIAGAAFEEGGDAFAGVFGVHDAAHGRHQLGHRGALGGFDGEARIDERLHDSQGRLRGDA